MGGGLGDAPTGERRVAILAPATRLWLPIGNHRSKDRRLSDPFRPGIAHVSVESTSGSPVPEAGFRRKKYWVSAEARRSKQMSHPTQ